MLAPDLPSNWALLVAQLCLLLSLGLQAVHTGMPKATGEMRFHTLKSRLCQFSFQALPPVPSYFDQESIAQREWCF